MMENFVGAQVPQEESSMDEKMIIVQTQDLVKLYNGEVNALNGVNLTIQDDEFVAVMGPSGSGKSTLLNMIGALDQPTSGEVLVAGEAISTLVDPDRFRSRIVGFIFQLHHLIPTLTAVENVIVPMRELRMSNKERVARANMLLEIVGLEKKDSHLPAQLSGGERQRVAIARALANEPNLILADEPTGNLDTSSGKEIMEIFKDLNRNYGTTVMVVTHDSSVARSADRIVYLQDGEIVRDECVTDPYLQDLREFKASGLGEAIQRGEIPLSIKEAGLVSHMETLKEMLRMV
jgi:ABC-type lipoprotein export system ATPase subunit